MASMPLSIPLEVKIKGLKLLVQGQADLLALVTQLVNGQMILAEAVGALQTEVRELVTNVEQLSTTLDNIQTDISGLKDAASVKAEADAATIAQLRTDLDAAIAAGGEADELRAALATAEESLANAQADFDASLAPVLAKAQDIDSQTPEAEVPETPAPPVEEPAPPVEEPATPVEEPTPPPVEGNVEPV